MTTGQQLDQLFQQLDIPPAATSADAIPHLTQLLYREAYIKGKHPGTQNPPDQIDPGDFLKQLQHPISGTRLLTDSSAYFYQVFSPGTHAFEREKIVRFYCNVDAPAAPMLVSLCTAILAKKHLPFSFKCLCHPEHYSQRSDVAVFYVPQSYADLSYRYLEEGLRPIPGRDNLPLFVHELGKGFGFAENPVDNDRSFGTNLCRVLAINILEHLNNQLPRTDWTAATLENLSKHGYTAEALYRNPSTCFPYEFI